MLHYMDAHVLFCLFYFSYVSSLRHLVEYEWQNYAFFQMLDEYIPNKGPRSKVSKASESASTAQSHSIESTLDSNYDSSDSSSSKSRQIEEQPSPLWTCGKCTLVNEVDTLNCTSCNQRRPRLVINDFKVISCGANLIQVFFSISLDCLFQKAEEFKKELRLVRKPRHCSSTQCHCFSIFDVNIFMKLS
jgi:hypothetical protein